MTACRSVDHELAGGPQTVWPVVGCLRQKQAGFSLAETLISLGLLGMLIPMLFFSYAHFTGVMVAEREKIGVAHAGSQFLNRLSLELSQTRTLLSTSDANNMYFAYYDPIRDEVIKRGYRLSANGTGLKKLEQLRYNETADAWEATTSYAFAMSSEIALPDTVEFDYCLESDCTVNPERALSVKLAGWNFYKVESRGLNYQLSLPDIQFYLASALTGDVLLSETPRQLFYFTGSNAFGTGNNLSLLALGKNGQELLNPVFAAASDPASQVTTVLDNSDTVASDSLTLNPTTGRAFFGDSTKFYSWLNGTLSTLVSGGNYPGASATMVDPVSGRVYFGEFNAAGSFYTWNGGTLTTITTNRKYPGVSAMAVDPIRERVFFAENNGAVDGTLMTWTSGGGLVTIDTGLYVGYRSMVADPDRDRLFYGFYDPAGGGTTGEYRIWTGGVMSTIATAQAAPGYGSSILLPGTGRVFFGDYNAAGQFYTWAPGDGAATALLPGTVAYPGLNAVAVHYAGERVYFGSSNSFYTWASATGLSTILTTVGKYPGYFNIGVDQNTGRVFFGEYDSSGSFYTWAPATGLSTLVSGRDHPGYGSVLLDPNSGRVFFGESNTGRYYTWYGGTLSTLLDNVKWPGSQSSTVDPNTGRVYIGSGEGSTTTNLYTWQNGTLSTLATGVTAPGKRSIEVDPVTGRVIFGRAATPARVSTWLGPATSNSVLKKANPFGVPSYQTMGLKYTADSYGAAAQDLLGDLYLVNNTDQTVDRYHYTSSEGRYKLISQMAWEAGTLAVRAMVIDQNGPGVSLLAQNGSSVWTIQKYADRTVSGTPAAPTVLSLAAVGSPAILSPTGLAISGRTGDYLVFDSGLIIGTSSFRLMVVDGTSGNLQDTILVDAGTTNLSVDSVTETNFKIAYNDQDNLLYLIAPTLGNVYGLSLSQYF